MYKRQGWEQDAREEGFEKGIEKGIEKGREEGIAKGREEEKQNLAFKLIKKNMSVQEVCEITGLSETEIQQVRAKN